MFRWVRIGKINKRANKIRYRTCDSRGSSSTRIPKGFSVCFYTERRLHGHFVFRRRAELSSGSEADEKLKEKWYFKLIFDGIFVEVFGC